jgi:hypothetical protein
MFTSRERSRGPRIGAVERRFLDVVRASRVAARGFAGVPYFLASAGVAER